MLTWRSRFLRVGLAAVAALSCIAILRYPATDVRVREPVTPTADPGLTPSRVRSVASTALSVDALALAANAAAQSGPAPVSDICLEVRTVYGQSVISLAADSPKLIASNTKLFTTSTALARLGAEYKFRTRVLASGKAAGSDGATLYLVGGGDPYLATGAFKGWEEAQDAHRPDTLLDGLADSVVAAGIRHVKSVVGDGGVFDDLYNVPSWPAEIVAQKQSPPIAGLSLNRNIVDFADSSRTGLLFADDPAENAADEFVRLLRARGVKVDSGGTRGGAPPGLGEVAGVESAPVGQLIQEINQQSDNFAAEMLLKKIGASGGGQGTTNAGLDIVRAEVAKSGVKTEGLNLMDGSGLSQNTATCAQLASLLVAVRSSSAGTAFVNSLAVAGASGTLQKRLLGQAGAGRIHAKTGSLRDVGSLSGYVETTSGPGLVFAYVLNSPGASAYRDAAEDAAVEPLLAFPSVGGGR